MSRIAILFTGQGAQSVGMGADIARDFEAAAAVYVWLKLLLLFDLVFITLSLWAFGPLTRAE